MKYKFPTSLLLVTLWWSAANAAGFDSAKPLLCASASVYECVPVNGCKQVSASAVNAPSFMRLDLAKNTITSVGIQGSKKSSTIERSETVEGKLVLQGAEEGIDGIRDGLGWTIAISENTGDMVVTASSDDAAFTIFGACTPL